jgi:hypothetical protein
LISGSCPRGPGPAAGWACTQSVRRRCARAARRRQAVSYLPQPSM